MAGGELVGTRTGHWAPGPSVHKSACGACRRSLLAIRRTDGARP
jgi:hypothetical protein